MDSRNLHRERVLEMGVAALALLAMLLLLPGSSTLPLLDRDEPRFSRATVEMMERGDWTVPFFNGQYRFDKPILTYWLMRMGYMALGVNELGARLHSILTTTFLAIWLARRAARWWDVSAGMATGLTFLYTLQILIHGRAAVADMPMVLCVAVAHGALWDLLSESSSSWPTSWWTLYLALGFGFLAKGPVAWMVPAVSLLLWRWVFLRRPLPWCRLRILPGIAVTLAVIAPWGLWALWRTEGQFWKIGMGYHVVRRGLEAFDGRRFIPFFYLPTALFSYFPWIAWLGAVWAVVRRDSSQLTTFLLSWLAAPYIIFSFYSTQLPHYILPGMPAFFLLLGRGATLSSPVQLSELPRWGRWWRAAIWGLGVVLGVAGGLFVALAPHDPWLAPLRSLGWAVLAVTAGLLWASRMYPRPDSVAMTASTLLLALGMSLAGRTLREHAAGPKLRSLLGPLPAHVECLWHRYTEPSVVFYTSHLWQEPGSVDALRVAMRKPGPRVVLTLADRTDLDDLIRARMAQWLGRPTRNPTSDYRAEVEKLKRPGYRLHELKVFNVATGSWCTLAVFENLSDSTAPQPGEPEPVSPSGTAPR